MKPDLGLYLHIPFCVSRCPYCDFVSTASQEALLPAYVRALAQEIENWAGRGLGARTVYFGGGTPSLLAPQQVRHLMEAVRVSFHLWPTAEVTLESNPGDRVPFSSLRSLGVSRLSLGAQSFHEAELHLMGRRHTVADIAEAFSGARKAGFDNINLDLLYGLPGQREEDFAHSLKTALALGPDHLSLYCLTLEAHTPLAQAIASGKLPDPDQDRAAEMYLLAEEALAREGFEHYELSNWAHPGKRCQHNLIYWENRPYMGFGAGAHSYFQGRRFSNVTDLGQYLSRIAAGQSPVEHKEQIGKALERAETMFLGLRLVEGVSTRAFARRFRAPPAAYYPGPVAELRQLGLLEEQGGHLRLTPRGRLLGNQVFYRFLSPE